MGKIEYTQILMEKLIEVGRCLWEKSETIQTIAAVLKEAENTGTFLPFGQICKSLGLGEQEEKLLCLLWYSQKKRNVGLPFERLLELTEKQSLEKPLAPCFWQEDGKLLLSPVTYSYLEGETPQLFEGAQLHFPQQEKCYGRQQLLRRGKCLMERTLSQNPEPIALVLSGEPGSGRHFLAEQLAGEYDMLLLTLEGAHNDMENRYIHELLLCVEWYDALLCVDIGTKIPEALLKKLSSYLPFILLIKDKEQSMKEDIGYALNIQTVEIPKLEWKREIVRDLLPEDAPVEALAARQLPMGRYIRYIRNLRTELMTGTFELFKDVYQPDSPHLSLIPADRSFEELKLPKAQLIQLDKICRIAAAREIVMEQRGFGQKFSYGNGLSVLFYGAPGTGKTMAAQVMANRLKMPLFQVDLSQLISKYIGETQKNIGRVFDEAAKCDCILLFDEADAIFAKRSEVSDAQDRYSNAETAYLLQRIERYEGISVLATNLLQNFDDAFRRRITYMLHFPMPDEAIREQLWETIFPAEAEVDSQIDYSLLAHTFELSGAAIKNAAFHSACCAAAENSEIEMKHILDGIKNEYTKLGKSFNEPQRQLMKLYEVTE